MLIFSKDGKDHKHGVVQSFWTHSVIGEVSYHLVLLVCNPMFLQELVVLFTNFVGLYQFFRSHPPF